MSLPGPLDWRGSIPRARPATRPARGGAAVVALALAAGSAHAESSGATRGSAHFLQYGVAFATESILTTGTLCASTERAPCILGSGGGVVLRAGYRARDPWYLGGSFGVSRHDSGNLLRLATLQQARVEGRYYVEPTARLGPYGGVGLGGAVYGNEFGVDTGGATGHVALGVEFEVSRTTVVGLAVAYRALALAGWTDRAGEPRGREPPGFGVAQSLGLELVLEARDPLPRW